MRVPLLRRLTALPTLLVAWAVVLTTTPAFAADAPAAPATPASAAAPYLDKVIGDGNAPLDIARDEADGGYDPGGSARALRVESRGQSSSSDGGRESSAWVSVRGSIDTLNYGALSLDASARLWEHRVDERAGSGVSFSLYQTAMPFSTGWFASQGLGVIQTLSTRVAGQQASFFVPTRLVQGASTQWSNERNGLTLQLSGGDAGYFSSIGQGSFYTTGNRVAALGLQLQRGQTADASLLPAGWTYGAIASSASGSGYTQVPGLGVRLGEAAGAGLFQTLRRDVPGGFMQANLVNERSQVPSDDASASAGSNGRANHLGAWLDGATQSGEIAHQWGVHHLGANLSWQGSSLGGNSQGGYYRWSWLGLRTQVDAQLSSTRAVDQTIGSGTYSQAGVSLRRYIDQSLSLGGLVQLARGSSDALQLSGYTEHRRSWADVRLQAGIETQDGRLTGSRVASDLTWTMPVGQRLMTSLAYVTTTVGALDASGATSASDGRSVEMGVSGGADLGERLQLDLNTRATLPVSSQAARLYQVSASGQWRLAPGWSLGVALSLSHTSGLQIVGSQNPIPSLPGSFFASGIYPNGNARDLWVTLRYDFHAGSSPVPIGTGGRAGGGAGSIAGVVYLDDNNNGRLDALETRAASVTVLLDGRYATRTDAQGRFEFPVVAPGPHTVSVASDTLPLPWTVAPAGGQRVEVVPRETVRLDIGASRSGAGARGE